jgi:hypothetical protein
MQHNAADGMSTTPQSRFRIIHWGAWVICSAALYLCYRTVEPDATNLGRIFAAEAALIDGAVFIAALTLIGFARRGAISITALQPGHWIVIYLATVRAIRLLLLGVASIASGLQITTDNDLFIDLSSFVFVLIPIVVLLIPVYYLRSQRLWKLFFCAEAFAAAVNFGYQLYFGEQGATTRFVNSLPDLVTGLSFLLMWCAVVSDIRQKDNRRDWVHWMGVLAYSAEFLFRVAFNTVGWRFFVPMIEPTPGQ